MTAPTGAPETTGLILRPWPTAGEHPVAECWHCRGSVYLMAGDTGLACCEGCGRRWRIELVLRVRRLR